MKITNRCSFLVTAFCFDTTYGYGNDVDINPGETADVQGPYLGEMGNGKCFVHIEGDIICQETPDDTVGFQVEQGYPLSLEANGKGVTVRHHVDVPEEYVLNWRTCNSSY
jgi:hypothetical protein